MESIYLTTSGFGAAGIPSHPPYSSSSCTKVGHIWQKKRENKRKGRGYILDPQKQRDDRWRHRDTKDLSAGSKSEANQLVLLTLMHCVHITISTNHYWFQHYFYSLEAAAYSVHAGSAAELMTQLHEHKKQTNNLVTDTVQWACTPP